MKILQYNLNAAHLESEVYKAKRETVPQIGNIQWKDRDSITAINFKREEEKHRSHFSTAGLKSSSRCFESLIPQGQECSSC